MCPPLQEAVSTLHPRAAHPLAGQCRNWTLGEGGLHACTGGATHRSWLALADDRARSPPAWQASRLERCPGLGLRSRARCSSLVSFTGPRRPAQCTSTTRFLPTCCRCTQLPEEVRAELLAELSERYTPQAYSLFSNNCNK